MIVTLWLASTPATKAPLVTGVPVKVLLVEVSCTVLVKSVLGLLLASRAVILMLKGAPAVCEPTVPPPTASTRKLFSGAETQ